MPIHRSRSAFLTASVLECTPIVWKMFARWRLICSATALEVAAYVSDHVVLRYASW
jgi:hypothetical protein